MTRREQERPVRWRDLNISSRYGKPMRGFCSSSLIAFVALLGGTVVFADETDLRTAAARVRQVIAHRGASAERPECTIASIRRAIEVGATAVEVDVRTSADGELFILHDATLDRTTSGSGPASDLTMPQLQQLDAGSWFDPQWTAERIPSLRQAAVECRGRADLLLDLKEQGDEYDRRVAHLIRTHGDPASTIVGVRSIAQARRFRTLLPKSRQLGLIPSVDQIEAFADAGVEMIRLWPRWLKDTATPVRRVHRAGCRLHLNGTLGRPEETAGLLRFNPDSLSSDDPQRLRQTLTRFSKGGQHENPLRLRVLSYNIHHGEGTDRRLDLARIAKVIKSVEPDIVALQEVDRNATRTHSVDQPAVFAELTQMKMVFGPNIRLQGGDYGNAVLSRFAILNSKNHKLPNVDAGEQRGVLQADLLLPDSKTQLRVFATHFDHRRDDKERVQSATAVNNLVSRSREPAVLIGDLNDVIGSRTLDALDEEWQRTTDKPHPTVPVVEPARQIDFILVRPAGRWNVVESKVLPEAIASDHRAILSVLELQQ